MTQDVAKTVAEYLSEDPTKWGKLASNIQWRRLLLLLLREILIELRKSNAEALEPRVGESTSSPISPG
jgi:hypothetical protein